jgi:3-deoxy-manno-octulosonate cytidylyltransferase (CMP-KDO synthetase)
MQTASFRVVIPARYASTRLPGKPLIPLCGEPMIVHVLRRAREAGASEIVVATDDARIAEVVGHAGARAVMTRADHPSGTDRLAEVAALLGYPDEAIVVNLQGDEPLMDPACIRDVAETLAAAEAADIATLGVRIADPLEITNPNAVKVVVDRRGRALYFSRAPIPWVRSTYRQGVTPHAVPTDVPVLRHVGLYAYRARTLARLTGLPPTPLEQAESLEQLRALEHGMVIQVRIHEGATPPPGVDTPEDVPVVERALGALKG